MGRVLRLVKSGINTLPASHGALVPQTLDGPTSIGISWPELGCSAGVNNPIKSSDPGAIGRACPTPGGRRWSATAAEKLVLSSTAMVPQRCGKDVVPNNPKPMFKAALRAKEIAAATWAMALTADGTVGEAPELPNGASKGKQGGSRISTQGRTADRAGRPLDEP
jgi:hypothetical protein